jgi:uncharacterized membrane protein YphA (DoxX/SURF4 family)/uncharacterized protein YqjF (DUF2071 family)
VKGRAAGELSAWVVAIVWLVHGGYNKLLGGSPRHLAIVQAIPGFEGATGVHALVIVGILEVCVGLWVIAGVAPRLCAVTQTAALIAMNIIELTFARHLLLWPAGLIPVNLFFLTLAWIAAGTARHRWLRVRLRRHPVPIEAHFRDCLTLTYALPASVLRPLLPPGLELETRDGYGFVAIALVQTESLRPAGLPAGLGQDFFLSGYRVFTRFRSSQGRSIRGLRILRSDANRRRMVVGGNLLTHYNYRHCRSAIDVSPDRVRVTVETRDGLGDLIIEADPNSEMLPAGSPFKSWREARYFAGPLPFTFEYEEETHSIIAIQAVRGRWKPTPIAVDVRRVGFFNHPCFEDCTPLLAAAFRVQDIDYRWERGVRIPLAEAPLSQAARRTGMNEATA